MILSPKCRKRCFSSQNTFAGCCHRNSTHSTTNVFFSQAACSAWRSRRQNCRSSCRREEFYPEKELQGQSGAVNHCSARVSEQLWTCTTERKNPPGWHPSKHSHPPPFTGAERIGVNQQRDLNRETLKRRAREPLPLLLFAPLTNRSITIEMTCFHPLMQKRDSFILPGNMERATEPRQH